MDFNYNKIFVRSDSTKHPSLIDIGTNERTSIPVTEEIYYTAYVTPFGAMFSGSDSITHFGISFDFNNGNLYRLGDVGSNHFKTSGNYAVFLDEYNYSYGPRVYFRNLATLSNTKCRRIMYIPSTLRKMAQWYIQPANLLRRYSNIKQ